MNLYVTCLGKGRPFQNLKCTSSLLCLSQFLRSLCARRNKVSICFCPREICSLFQRQKAYFVKFVWRYLARRINRSRAESREHVNILPWNSDIACISGLWSLGQGQGMEDRTCLITQEAESLLFSCTCVWRDGKKNKLLTCKAWNSHVVYSERLQNLRQDHGMGGLEHFQQHKRQKRCFSFPRWPICAVIEI